MLLNLSTMNRSMNLNHWWMIIILLSPLQSLNRKLMGKLLSLLHSLLESKIDGKTGRWKIASSSSGKSRKLVAKLDTKLLSPFCTARVGNGWQN